MAIAAVESQDVYRPKGTNYSNEGEKTAHIDNTLSPQVLKNLDSRSCLPCFSPRSPASNAAHIRHSNPAASTQRKLKSNEPSAFAGTGFMSQMLRRVIDAQSSSRLRLLEAWPPRQATSLALAQLFNTPSVEVIHRTKDPDPLLGNALPRVPFRVMRHACSVPNL